MALESQHEAVVEPQSDTVRRYPLEQEVELGSIQTPELHSARHCSNIDTTDFHRRPSSSSSTSSTNSSDNDAPSNETLLGTAFISFMSFAILQLIFAIIAGSDAMMGDSAAMMVDAFTYLINWCAERRKKQLERATDLTDSTISMQSIERYRRKQILKLEIIPPLLSVSTLLIITVVVFHKATKTFLLDMHSSSQLQIPNLNLMMTFSVLNLALDGLNVFCFARAKHLLGYATVEEWDEEEEATRMVASTAKRSYSLVEDDEKNSDGVTSEAGRIEITRETQPSRSHHQNHSEHANLNMCSAYTHVFADTLRSIAVLIAAALAKVVPGVSAIEADAAAAILVSFLIVLSLVPLFQGLNKSLVELRSINAFEKQEARYPRHSESVGVIT